MEIPVKKTYGAATPFRWSPLGITVYKSLEEQEIVCFDIVFYSMLLLYYLVVCKMTKGRLNFVPLFPACAHVNSQILYVSACLLLLLMQDY